MNPLSRIIVRLTRRDGHAKGYPTTIVGVRPFYTRRRLRGSLDSRRRSFDILTSRVRYNSRHIGRHIIVTRSAILATGYTVMRTPPKTAPDFGTDVQNRFCGRKTPKNPRSLGYFEYLFIIAVLFFFFSNFERARADAKTTTRGGV